MTDTTTGTGDTTSRITMTTQTAARLAELLQQCHTLPHHPAWRPSRAGRLLPAQPVTTGWLAEMLDWHALHLQAKIDDLTRQDQR